MLLAELVVLAGAPAPGVVVLVVAVVAVAVLEPDGPAAVEVLAAGVPLLSPQPPAMTVPASSNAASRMLAPSRVAPVPGAVLCVG